jgi:hypothetical protein
MFNVGCKFDVAKIFKRMFPKLFECMSSTDFLRSDVPEKIFKM